MTIAMGIGDSPDPRSSELDGGRHGPPAGTGTRTNLYSYDAFGGPVEALAASSVNSTTERWTGAADHPQREAALAVVGRLAFGASSLDQSEQLGRRQLGE